MTLILNTWIFETAVKNGTAQVDLIPQVVATGADGIEVRREYFTDPATELAELHKAAQKAQLIVNYSIPDELFLPDGQPNPALPKYFAEAEQLGASKIKFNVGNFTRFTGDLATVFSNLPLAKVKLNVENDQTPVSGTPDAIINFLTAARKARLNSIGYVFDLGNWAFTGFDPITAAKQLAPFCDYIHLKNSLLSPTGKMTTTDDLRLGQFNWQIICSYLPKDVQFALEFPMETDQQLQDQVQLVKEKVGG